MGAPSVGMRMAGSTMARQRRAVAAPACAGHVTDEVVDVHLDAMWAFGSDLERVEYLRQLSPRWEKRVLAGLTLRRARMRAQTASLPLGAVVIVGSRPSAGDIACSAAPAVGVPSAPRPKRAKPVVVEEDPRRAQLGTQ